MTTKSACFNFPLHFNSLKGINIGCTLLQFSRTMDFAINAVLHYIRREEEENVEYDRVRLDLSMMTEREYKMHFRFSKENIHRLAEILDLERDSNRGQPLTSIQQVCIALNSYAGQPFQRTNALSMGVSQPTVHRVLETVSSRLIGLKNHFIKMQNHAKKADASKRQDKTNGWMDSDRTNPTPIMTLSHVIVFMAYIKRFNALLLA